MRLSLRARRSATALMAGALVLVPACSNNSGGSGGTGGKLADTSGLPPQQALTKSLENVRAGDAARVTFGFDTTADALVALSQATGGSQLTTQQADLIASAQLIIETKSANGKALNALSGGTDLSAADVEFAIALKGERLLQIRVSGGNLYLRIDAEKIAAAAGLQAKLTQLKSQVAGAPPQFAFAAKAIAGEWLEIEGTQLKALGQQFGGAGGLGGGSAAPNADQLKQFSELFKTLLTSDVTTTRLPADDKGDHLQLTASVRKLATDILTGYKSLFASNPLLASRLGDFDVSQVPDRDVTLDAHIKDGRLREIAVDLIQFQTAAIKTALAGKKVNVAIGFETSVGDLSAPSGATKLDLASLAASFGGLLGGLGGLGASATASAEASAFASPTG